MYGHATFKSHILRRDEKGVFGIPFKRLLGCGLGAGALFTVMRMALPDQAFVFGVVSLILLLVFTTPRGGIPRWRHVVLNGRWRLMSAAALTPHSLSGQLGQTLGLQTDQIEIDADRLFSALEDEAPRTALTDWVSFNTASAADTELGLTFNARPDLALHGGAS